MLQVFFLHYSNKVEQPIGILTTMRPTPILIAMGCSTLHIQGMKDGLFHCDYATTLESSI